MQGYLWIIWVKFAGALWIIGGKIRQLINILFCGYQNSGMRLWHLSMKGLAPPYLCDKFEMRSKIHSVNTRNKDKLDIPLYNSASGQRTFHYRAVSRIVYLEWAPKSY